ncbi:hypothetical protein A2U01_0085774, partial [Trifolium medium]|nr:hypothetical protein [Trifolium medium]
MHKHSPTLNGSFLTIVMVLFSSQVTAVLPLQAMPLYFLC